MKTAMYATARLVDLLFAHRGGRYGYGVPVASMSTTTPCAYTPDESDPFSYAYFGA